MADTLAVSYPNIQARVPRVGDRSEVWTYVSGALLGFCSVAYFYAAILLSIKNPLWLDEVMAKWMSQLPADRILQALLHGTMASPPTYFYFLKGVRFVFGGSNLALRFPSIVAVFAASLVVFILMLRRFALPYAALAMALSLETGLFGYATQVREYALVTACFAFAVMLWDAQPADVSVPAWRVLAITVLLTMCVALHFYGVLLVAAFALMEILWSLVNGRIRRGLWIGIIAAGCSVLAWYPLMRHIMRLIGFYSDSPGYFALPTLPRLFTSYSNLALGGKGASLLCCALLFIAAASLWAKINGESLLISDNQEALGRIRPSANLEIITVALVCIPVIVFVFAVFVTKTFNDRYAIAASLGFALLFAMLISHLRAGAALSSLLLLASIALFALIPRHVSSDHYGMPLWSSITENAPIVVGEGLAFMELQEAAQPALRQRLVFLTQPPGDPNPDPTNEDIVKRWSAFRPGMQVEDRDTFLRDHSHFFVLHSNQSTDVITPSLLQAGRLKALSNIHDEHDDRGIWLFESLPYTGSQSH